MTTPASDEEIVREALNRRWVGDQLEPFFALSRLAASTATVARLEAEIERLTKERDEAHKERDIVIGKLTVERNYGQEQKARAQSAGEELAALQQAARLVIERYKVVSAFAGLGHAIEALRVLVENGPTRSKALEDVRAERERQKTVEGWTPAHDDEHSDGSMASAAGCYALNARGFLPHIVEQFVFDFWPWGRRHWKPKDPRRDLVRAGALILAELERLDRVESKGGTSCSS